MNRIFYVYEHWRPDKDVCFWVGKGKGGRAYWFRRNRYYNSIVNKLSKLGMCVEVRLVASGLKEEQAFALEIERINFWHDFGIRLANLTIGGEGRSGAKHSITTRTKMSKAHKGRKKSREHVIAVVSSRRKRLPNWYTPQGREGIIREMKRRIGTKHSEVTREKIRIAHLGKKRPPEFGVKCALTWLGRKHSEEAKAKMRAAKLGKKISIEHRRNISLGLLRNKNSERVK